jgi:hypothetical protein
MVVIHTDLRCAMTASSMTRMSSLSEKLWVNLIYNLDFVFSLIRKSQHAIVLISSHSNWFEVWTVRMACMTLAHGQMNYHVSQYSQWNQNNSFTYRNRFVNRFLQRHVVNYHIVCRLSTHDLRANTLCSPESNSCMVPSYGGHIQG